MADTSRAKAPPMTVRVWRKLRRAADSLTGRAPASPELKRSRIRQVAKDFKLDILVETGTYLGDTVEASREHFRRIISVEVAAPLHARARERFASYPHIQLLLGDSGELMPAIVADLDGPALFWLDGHYSEGETGRGAKDTPIIQELRPILSDTRFRHVLLIDDARHFKGKGDYPTVREVIAVAEKLRPGSLAFVRDDAIHIYPPGATISR